MFHNLPKRKFNTVVIDPPWDIQMAPSSKKVSQNSRPTRMPYFTIGIEGIKSFPLRKVAEAGAHIYLWTTNKMLRNAFEILECWEVTYHLTMPIVKRSGIAPLFSGYIHAAEYCLLGFFGKPMQPFEFMGKLNWLVTAPVQGNHSVKPSEFYDLVKIMSPGPYLDCFARRERKGWTVWGDEVDLEPEDENWDCQVSLFQE